MRWPSGCETDVCGRRSATLRPSPMLSPLSIRPNGSAGRRSSAFVRERYAPIAEALEYGMVGINTGAISSELAPFGGVRESGIRREGSRHGVGEFVELKDTLTGGLDK